MHMAGAECEGIMHQRGVHGLLAILGHVQQVRQVAKVPVTPSDSVPGAVFVQHKHLPGREPTLERDEWEIT